MRTLAFLRKTTLENLREWKILSLALVFAPCFVYLMYGYFGAAPTSYRLLVLNHEPAAEQSHTEALLEAWREAKHKDEQAMFEVTEVSDLADAKQRLENKDADLLVELPATFTRDLEAFRTGAAQAPAALINCADEANVRSSMAMALSDYVAFSYAMTVAEVAMPLDVKLEAAGSARGLSEFDFYVPALLVLALIMLLFTAATALVKEVDKGTMSRLMLSRLTTIEMFAAISITQIAIGVVALALAFLAALSVGYRTEGSLLSLVVVGAVSALSVVAMAVLVASLLKSMFELLTVGTFPFFIVMFFSECMFPLPKVELFAIAGNTLYANDILPTSLTVKAFNKILNFGAGLGDVAFELVAILVLTGLYFALGTWLYRRRHQRI